MVGGKSFGRGSVCQIRFRLVGVEAIQVLGSNEWSQFGLNHAQMLSLKHAQIGSSVSRSIRPITKAFLFIDSGVI